jgi:hypothetical protein
MTQKCACVLFSFILSSFNIANVSGEDSSVEAIGLLVKAYQNSGFNPAIFGSGKAEFEVVTEQHGNNKVLTDFFKQLGKLPETGSGGVVHSTKQRLKYFFLGNDRLNGDAAKPYLRYYDLNSFPSSRDTWVNVQITLSQGRLNKKDDSCMSIKVMPGNKIAYIQKGYFSYADYQEFGRYQEIAASTVALLIRKKIDRSNFSMPQDFTDFFLSELANRNLELKVSGEIVYDFNHRAKVIEITKEGKLHEKYHIDASRGYICPYIEVQSGLYSDVLESSNYIQEKNTNLFYPTFYTETSVDKVMGGTTVQSYQLLPDTLLFNQKISEREFAIDIPEGAWVTDELEETPIKYQSVKKGTLSLTKGGYDVSKMKWLVREEDVASYIPSQGGVSGYVRLVFVSVGIIMIVFALYFKFKNRQENV